MDNRRKKKKGRKKRGMDYGTMSASQGSPSTATQVTVPKHMKPIGMKEGGKVCKGMGAALRGGNWKG